MANGVIKNPDAIEVLTPVVTKTSGNSVVVSVSALRKGKIVNLCLELQNSGGTVSAGSNAFEGTISGIPAPIDNVVGCAYYASAAMMSALSPDLEIVVRVLASTLAKGSNTYKISWIYLTE